MPPDEKAENLNEGEKSAAKSSGSDLLKGLGSVSVSAINDALKQNKEQFTSMTRIQAGGGAQSSGSQFCLFDSKSRTESKSEVGVPAPAPLESQNSVDNAFRDRNDETVLLAQVTPDAKFAKDANAGSLVPDKIPAGQEFENTFRVADANIWPYYTGERIHRNVQPVADYKVNQHTLGEIAKERLGKDASQAEVETYIKEIAKANGLPKDNPAWEPNVKSLVLPGHNLDGDCIWKDRDGTERTYTSLGQQSIKHPDGTSELRLLTADGGKIEHHSGPRESDNYSVWLRGDGKAFLREGKDGSDWVTLTHPEKDIRIQRLRLEEKAAENMNERELLQFRADMKGLDQRFVEFRKDWLTDKERQVPELVDRNKQVAETEVAKTFSEASHLLEAKTDSLPTHDNAGDKVWRVKLVQHAMHHAGDPTSVDQGPYPLCPVSAMEARLYTRNPADVMELLSETALNGRFAGKGELAKSKGTHPSVDLTGFNRVSLMPDNDSRAYTLDMKDEGAMARSYASQVFDAIALNLVLSQREPSLTYQQVPDRKVFGHGFLGFYIDSGHPLESGPPPWKHKVGLDSDRGDKLGVTDSELIEMNRQITGNDEKYFVIERALGDPTKPYKDIGVTLLWKAESLPETLIKLKELNLLPAIATVDPRKPPIIDEWNNIKNIQGRPTESHAVNIPKVSRNGLHCSVDNFWGVQGDSNKLDPKTGELPVDSVQLGKAIMSPGPGEKDSQPWTGDPRKRHGQIPASLKPCTWE